MNLMDEGSSTHLALEEALLRYYHAIDQGQPIPPEELIAAYPALAAQLELFFAGEKAVRCLPPDSLEEAPPDLGDLIPVEELGAGGMGVVYRVRDPQLGRDLAVKVLRSRFVDNDDIRCRFVEEAQIGAQLQHPGVVPVHALGALPSGRPFFTMKLVRGRTLAALLAERPAPREELPRFLGIFEQVCQTVAFAHAHHVIHRDLKPQNIMVGAFGEVQVMDWGLAKVLRRHGAEVATVLVADAAQTADAEPRTHTGEALGTLAYMPPEQARGEVNEHDQRCDVFALGAILCEILTGKPPYPGAAREVMDQVRRGELTEARSRLAGCGADAELIELARRCLAADRQDRPNSAAEVAQALKSYQEGLRERLRRTELDRAAAAVREAAAVRTVQAERRTRRRSIALALAVLALVVGGAWAAWRHQAEQATRSAEAAAQQSALERDVAVEVGETTTLIAQGWQLQDTPERWATLLHSARTPLERAERLLTHPACTEDMEQQVQQARTALEEAERSQRLMAACERVRMRLADSTGGRWNTAELSAGYAAAFQDYGLDILHADTAVITQRLSRHPLRARLLDALEEWQMMAADLEVQGRLIDVLRAVDPEPQSFRRHLRDVLARRDGPALLELARSEEARTLSPTATTNLATILVTAGQWESLLDYVAKNKGHVDPRTFSSRDLPANYPGRTEALALLRDATVRYPDDFWLHQLLAMLLDSPNDTECVEGLAQATAAVALRPTSGSAWYGLGLILDHRGEREHAIACYRKALELDPQEVRARLNLALVLWTKNDLEAAVAECRAAVTTAPHYSQAHLSLANVLLAQGKTEEALAEVRTAVACNANDAAAHLLLCVILARRHETREALAEVHTALRLRPDEPATLLLLADLMREDGKLDDALATYQRVLERGSQIPSMLLASAYHGVGQTLMLKKDNAGALRALRLAAETNPADPMIKANLARLLAENKADPQKVLSLLQEAVAREPANDQLLLDLGKAWQDLGKDDDALAVYRKAVALNGSRAEGHMMLGAVLLKKQQPAEALDELTRAVALDGNVGMAHILLGMALSEKGDLARALEEVKKGLVLTPDDRLGLNFLGSLLEQIKDDAGAIVAYRKFLALEEGNAAVRCRLGRTLGRSGNLSGAAAEFQKVLDRDAQHFDAVVGLGMARASLGDQDGAIAAFEKASGIRKDAQVLRYLISLWMSRGDWPKAERGLRDMAEVDPASAAMAHAGRTDCLLALGDLDGAVAAARESIRVGPNLAVGHYSLGRALQRQRHDEEALQAFQEAVKLAPTNPEMHFALGGILHMRNRFAEAAAQFHEACERSPVSNPRREFFAQQQRYCELAVQLQSKLPAILRGEEPPKGYEELLTLASLCSAGDRRSYAAAVRFFRAAFAARPELADELACGYRRLAAGNAVRAAAGEGDDVANLDESERSGLRKQGLDWLQADLALLEKAVARGAPAERPFLRLGLQEMLVDPDLACVRSDAGLEKLSAEDRRAWEDLWEEVQALLCKLGS